LIVIGIAAIAQHIDREHRGAEGRAQSLGAMEESALGQAAHYAHQLQLATITVVFFVEAVDDENRTLYETPHHDPATGVTVEPVLVTTVE
jgi:hypothetical protein